MNMKTKISQGWYKDFYTIPERDNDDDMNV